LGVPVINTDPMTVEEFYAFTERQPDEEKWELIDGEAVLNASPSPLHQWIVRNLIAAIVKREPEQGANWGVLPGIGVRVSDVDRPEPDVLILPRAGPIDPQRRDRSDVIVTF
jgi:Uma2 family endonuclease